MPDADDLTDLADRLALHELVARHGHCVDAGDLAGLDQVFTDDVLYDVSALGGEPLIGLAAIEEAARALGDRNPVAHHVTNVVVDLTPDRASIVSKGLGVTTDGRVGSVVYEDVAVRTEAGWRIARRIVHPRRTPLQP
ncbi:nuclear transport factor 2 family protein [Actinomycetospora termitidis]|uniref:Nuclear transport factor 2 family protein n=1 Tax=Actinomycetospora termitidis TaxID=3053470 RepID=A0ABT7M8B8_9PSEU|nr:nuclear transport factor 2 family protein [Actinomycetospora sp. Odt1-22]MDL5156701.1 nuclear transport factor 2 family protein [Actinomycetospora sp. Odt1-22]